MSTCDTREVVEWLMDGARSEARPDMVLARLCEGLVRCGIPLWRVAVFVRTLHPEIMGRQFTWRPGTEVVIGEAPFDIMETPAYRQSPPVAVIQSGQAIRRRLIGDDPNTDFPVLDEFRAEGMTDYLATPLIFTDGAVHAATWSTREPDGFSDAQIAGLQSVVLPLARVAEIRALRRNAANLLNTYVGNDAGERILAGRIRRGHTEAIHAAIWLSDMRGFTAAADSLPPQTLVDLLNRYFDCQVPAIVKHEGQVLKFMGDGLLAIFPLLVESNDARDVCRRALAAAREAEGNIAAIGAAAGTDRVRFGLALHLGQVLYGNIGSGNRLDFTCIGPAVNLAARLESLAARLGRTIVLSADFARHCEADALALGEFAVPGFAAPQAAFGLRDNAL
jgi:adenylate cyclase